MPPGIGYRGMQLADIVSAPGRPRMSPLRALAASQSPSAGPTGLAALLQRPGLRDALMATGSAMLAQSGQPGTFGSALGNALPMGMQAYQQGQQQDQINKIIETMPPEQQRLLKSLPGPQQAQALMGMMTPRKRDTAVVGKSLVDTSTGEPIYSETPDEPEMPTDARMFEFYSSLSPEQREMYDRMQAAGRGPLVSVNTGDNAASAFSSKLGGDIGDRLTTRAAGAEQAMGMAESLAAAEELLNDPAMRTVTGPGANIKTVLQRFADDPRGRQLAAQFDILTSELVLEKLQSFPGQLSEKELEFAEKASAKDRNMTVEELQAGIGLLRRIARRDIQGYIQEIESVDPTEWDVTEGQLRPYRGLAERARTFLGSIESDPLGIRGGK